VVDPAFVHAVLASEEAQAEVFVAASFSEPILPELRSLANIPVASMSEACFMAASTSAPQIGFVTLNKHIIPYIEKSISLHKWKTA
jgi:Asp/Glu/hydantoin racemase